ncbi:MAG: hypothetical protein ABSB88_04720 [Bryobacteraceae bacterium]|jgi:hypothetical protein
MRLLMLVVLLGGMLFAQTPTAPVTEQRDPSQAPGSNSWQYSQPLSGGMLFAQTPTLPVTKQSDADQAPSFKDWQPSQPLIGAAKNRKLRAPSLMLGAAFAKSGTAIAPARVCAIPLVNVQHADPHDAISIPLSSLQTAPTATVEPPAPSCDDKKR